MNTTIFYGKNLDFTSFPLGGIGAGMFCIEGTAKLASFSLWHKPEILNEPYIFAALHIRGEKPVSKVLEGPVPRRKIFYWTNSGNGLGDKTYGFPRFEQCSFKPKFPFAQIELKDSSVPVTCNVNAWSPFIPGEADNSSLPFAALEYCFRNNSRKKISAVFYFFTKNFMDRDQSGARVKRLPNGFILSQRGTEEKPWAEGEFCITTDAKTVKVNTRLFNGVWFDTQSIIWRQISNGEFYDTEDYPENEQASPGGCIAVPLTILPGKESVVTMRFSWFVPYSNIKVGNDPQSEESSKSCSSCASDSFYRPWYSSKFSSASEVNHYCSENYKSLKSESAKFANTFFDSSLPPEVIESIAANLCILKSPTVLRQYDGRLWGWEGCFDNCGCCHGSCTHVWNYAQSIPHLFPNLERTLRETEFKLCQDERGHQNFRANLPLRPTEHNFHAAADGQLGGIMKVFREWKISGNNEWLRSIWPAVKKSLEYCIKTWDPDEKGIIIEPHHNTYDIEFWGPDGLCQSFYIGALTAAAKIQDFLGEESSRYYRLASLAKNFLQQELFNGEYVIQKVIWQGLKTPPPGINDQKAWNVNYNKEALEIVQKEGPNYQYGKGCLSDGILGDWMARVCGIGPILDEKISSNHLKSVFKYNFKNDLSNHVNPQRAGFALGKESGLTLCSWPKGDKPLLPFPYSDEVWTGIEYQVASHLIMHGEIKKARRIIKAIRKRYDGTARNQFNEYECGHWYARAMSSYALLQAFSGARFDAVEKILYLKPAVKGDFKCFFAWGNCYGYVGIKNKRPFFKAVKGKLQVKKIVIS